MEKHERIEEYKILVDIYYKELDLSYTKITIFTTIQIGMLAGAIAAYNTLLLVPVPFCIGVFCMTLLSVVQIMISIRNNTVNRALISTLAEFEKESGFTLLQAFNANMEKTRGIRTMNFPSYIMIAPGVIFLLGWALIFGALLVSLIRGLTLPMPAFLQGLAGLTGFTRTAALCASSALYAVTMKMADLLDEHGMKLFKGASFLFSFLCAVFGCLMMVLDDTAANMVFAMIMGFVVRKRLDYNNHIVCFVLLSSWFFLCSGVNAKVYFPFLFGVIALGLVKDSKYKATNSRFMKAVHRIYLYVPIVYALPALVYSAITSDWAIFWTFFTYDAAYNITRLVGERNRPAAKEADKSCV